MIQSHARGKKGRMDSVRVREELLGNDFDVRFFVVPVIGLSIELVAPSGASWKTATGGDFMQHYKVVGDAAARSLLNRLSKLGEDYTTILGTLAPLAPITLAPEAKKAAMIPVDAAFFSFAYPLDNLDASSRTLMEIIIGSVSRLDDELFFFFLFGGFCYFDANQTFLQANAISLKRSKGVGELRFDGPYPASPGAADVFQASTRLGPLPLLSLNEVGLVKFGWCNPSECPDGRPLHDSIEWQHGAFVYERSDGQVVFYRTTPLAAGADAGSSTARVKMRARGWQREHTGFMRMQTYFETQLAKSRQLRMSLERRKRGAVERWLRSFGIIITLYYTIGAIFFHLVEGWEVFDCLYFMTVTATTVGYGDLAPVTVPGRALSTVYMPFGTIVTMTGLLGPVGFVLGSCDQFNALLIAKSQDVARACGYIVGPWIDHVLGGWLRRARHPKMRDDLEQRQTFMLRPLCRPGAVEVGPYGALVHAILTPVEILLIMAAITGVVKSKTVVDSLYYGMVTMTVRRRALACARARTRARTRAHAAAIHSKRARLSLLLLCLPLLASHVPHTHGPAASGSRRPLQTVGYGDADLLPSSTAEKAYTIAFMLFSTTALVTCVERLQVLSTSRRVFLQDFRWQLPHMMRREAIKEHTATPTIVEDEFVLHVLEEYRVVDADLIHHIRNDFKKIEEYGLATGDHDEIELTTLFEHLVARGKILDSNRVMPNSDLAERNLRRRRDGSRAGRHHHFGKSMKDLNRLASAGSGGAGDHHAEQQHLHHRGGGRDDIPISVVDMSVPDRGYSEWVTEVWTPYLEADHEFVASLQAHREKRKSKTSTRRHNALGRAATKMRTRHLHAGTSGAASALDA